MRTIADTQKNHSAGISNSVPWRVVTVKPLPNFTLEVQFVDGTRGLVDMKHFLARECGVFKVLREVATFNQMYVDHGAVNWPGELDLSPDRMHDELNKANIYVMS